MLDGLDTINWATLTHAHGEATDVPVLIRSLLSENDEARMDALAALHEQIWHQGTVSPAAAAAVPFLYELLAAPDVQDKSGIVSLLGCIANGEGVLQSAIRNDGEEMWRRILGRQGQSLENALAEEIALMKAIHRAMSAGLRYLLPYLSDPEDASLVAEALGNYPEHASWLVPAIDAALAAESEEHVRQALTDSKTRLTSGCSGSSGRAVEPGRQAEE
jgi:hypothetical protein